MNALVLFSVFGASLMGSVHCAGMCGGMVGFATASLNRKRRVAGHVGYHLGRLVAYMTLGMAAGAFGLGVDTAAARGGVGGSAALLAGGLMIVWALVKLLPGQWAWVRASASKSPARLGCSVLGRGFSLAFTWVKHLPTTLRSSALGLATGLLPCGWLYAFVLAAVGTGNILAGAALLFAFWLGTVPALLGVGSLAQLLGTRAQRWLPTLSACVLLVIGLGSVWSRYDTAGRVLEFTPNAWHESSPNPSTNGSDDDALPPCHRH